MVQPLSDSKILTRLFTVLGKIDNVLSSAKLWTDTLHRQKKKSSNKILNKIGPTIEPFGAPDIIVWKLLFMLLILIPKIIWTYFIVDFSTSGKRRRRETFWYNFR